MSAERKARVRLGIEQVFGLSEIEFLKAIVERYPETRLMAGEANASPEGQRLLGPESLARQVFSASELFEGAVEADRAFMGMLLLRDCLLGISKRFSLLSEQSFQELRSHALSILESSQDLEACAYCLACNDLGKTHRIQSRHREIFGPDPRDHDQTLSDLRSACPEMFPGLALIGPAHAQMLRLADQADFNLGQFVQGETPSASLSAMAKTSKAARDLRLLAEIFDFAGAAGHVDSHASLTLTEDNLRAYARAMAAMEDGAGPKAWSAYHAWRAKLCSIATHEAPTLGRLCSLTRSFDPAAGALLSSAWSALDELDRATLSFELSRSGDRSDSAILPYYGPAYLAGAIRAGQLRQGLSGLAALMRAMRSCMQISKAEGIQQLDLSMEALG